MASKKPSGLGRGLGALLGDDVLKTGDLRQSHASHFSGGKLFLTAPEVL